MMPQTTTSQLLYRPFASPTYYPAQQPGNDTNNLKPAYRSDFQCSLNFDRPPSMDSESQMRVYEQLEKEADERKLKEKHQLELILRHTEQMKSDLGVSEEARTSNRGHLSDIETFETQVKVRLRKRLLTERQCEEIVSLQMGTLSELRQLVNGTVAAGSSNSESDRSGALGRRSSSL